MAAKPQDHHQQKVIETIFGKRQEVGITSDLFALALCTPLPLTFQHTSDHVRMQHDIHSMLSGVLPSRAQGHVPQVPHVGAKRCCCSRVGGRLSALAVGIGVTCLTPFGLLGSRLRDVGSCHDQRGRLDSEVLGLA